MSDSSTAVLNRLLSGTRDLSIFQPDDAQRRAKSNFWTYFATEEGVTLPPTPDLALALRFGADSRITRWWILPGFQDWFLNREEFKQRMEYLSNLCLDQLETILTTTSSANSDKLNAIKLIMQVARKTPTSSDPDTTKYADDKIGKMGRVELEEFIRRNIRIVGDSPESNVDNTPKP